MRRISGMPERHRAGVQRLTEVDTALADLRERWTAQELPEQDRELAAAAVKALLAVARRFEGEELVVTVRDDVTIRIRHRQDDESPTVHIDDRPVLPAPREPDPWVPSSAPDPANPPTQLLPHVPPLPTRRRPDTPSQRTPGRPAPPYPERARQPSEGR